MDKVNEENNQPINKEEEVNDSKQVNENKSDNYIESIEEAKKPFKREIIDMPTKDEKLIYIRQQIQKYSILKENHLVSNFMIIFISFIFLVSMILLFSRTSNTIFFKRFMFILIIVSGILWTVLFLNMKKNNRNYCIILFALEEIRAKLIGSIENGEEFSKLNKDLRNIDLSIEGVRHEVKEGYAIIEKKLKDSIKKYN